MDVAFMAARNVAFAVAGGLWIGTILWACADARARLIRPRTIHTATALVALLPFLGLVAWISLRPSETLAERRERKLRRRAYERLIDEGVCVECGTELEDDFLCCPGCGTKIRNRCGDCGRSLELTWRACPHCAGRIERDAEPALRAAAH
jgi:DNA-directed RNA polymerase subunit RPC12/RpoP